MLRASALVGFLLMAAGTAQADCIGSTAFSTCYDAQSGNSYTVQRFGNSTYMNGYNANTGSNWDQQSYSYGNMTQHFGTDANGQSWNSTTFGSPYGYR